MRSYVTLNGKPYTLLLCNSELHRTSAKSINNPVRTTLSAAQASSSSAVMLQLLAVQGVQLPCAGRSSSFTRQ